LYKTKDTTEAIGYFELFLETPTTEFSEVAAWRTANYYYGVKDYVKGLKYYEKLDQIASKPSEILNAKIGIMRCSFLTENFEKSALASKAVLETTGINNQQRTEAEYAKGISNYKQSNFELAKPSLEWLVKNTTSAMGSEAKYTLAEMYYKQALYPQADIEIKALLKMKPSYNFWVAKGLLLQVRIQMINDELFQAEQTLKSVIEHYPNETDGILSEANELWDELMQLKNPQEKEEEENQKRIEIND
jgi:tetratricopeptide (TPR) repeat protein